MTSAGFNSSQRERICTALSTPVVPRTPVRQRAVSMKPANSAGEDAFKCRVTSMLDAARLPSASGVMSGLPSAAIRHEDTPSPPQRRISSATACAASEKLLSPRSKCAPRVSVKYRPCGLPSVSAPRRSSMSTQTTRCPCISSSLARMPSASPTPEESMSRASLARSVLPCRSI